MTTPQSAKDKIKGAQRARRSYRLNLRGDLRAQVELLDMELKDLRQAEQERPDSSRRLTDTSESMALAQRITDLRAMMSESWLDLTLEARKFTEWQDFKTANPAREGNEVDETAGINFDKLLFEFTPKCVVEPELDAEDWEGIFDKCSPGDLRDLGSVAFALHVAGSDIPLSRAASVVMRQNDALSEQPETGESAPDGSEDGSQPRSTSDTAPEEPSSAPPSSPESQSGTTTNVPWPKD